MNNYDTLLDAYLPPFSLYLSLFSDFLHQLHHLENVYDLKKSSSSPLVLRFCEMKENHHALPWKGQEEKIERKLNQEQIYVMLKMVVFFWAKANSRHN